MNNLQEKVIRAMVDMYGFYSIEELSEMTEISISSIKRSLKDITKFIEDYDGKLLRVPKKGICMVVTDQQRENILEALDSYANGNPESFYYRKNYILDILFNYPANYTVQLFSEELCVSRKMIEKDLKMIEEYLATFHLELSKVQNQGISIVGREFDIRQAIVDTQNKKYWKHTYIEELPQELDYRISKRAFTYFSDYYSKEDIMMVQEYLADSEAELGVVLVDISFCRLTEYLLLTKRRMEEGNKIRNKADRTMTKLDDIYVETAKKILDRMFPHEDEMELEYQFLAAKFAVAKTCEVEAEIQDDYLMNIAEDYIYTVFMAMEKESTYHYRELEKQIATFLKKISIRHDYMLVEWDDLHKDVQQQIQSSYAVCLTYSFHLEEKLGFVLTQDEIAWLALLIHQASMETGSEKQGIFVMATTKKETIAQVSKLLLEQGCLSEDVTEKVFELEERRPTTIGSQIAMAHVYKDSVKKSGIAVMRMKYPVKWSRSSKVKLVFFLAINMEESNEILKLFKYLYALIDNKEDIQKILEANSSGEIYELLMEEFH